MTVITDKNKFPQECGNGAHLFRVINEVTKEIRCINCNITLDDYQKKREQEYLEDEQ